MDCRVLLTGANGFVGRQVLRSLIGHGARVRVVVRKGKGEGEINCETVESIITTPDLFGESQQWWADACENVDVVIHTAWYVEPGKYLQSEKNLQCLSGTIELAKGAALAGVKRFVGIGTCFEYDLSCGMLSVNTPLRPLTLYAGAKVGTFAALSQYLPDQGVSFAWCRLFYLFGEGEDGRRLVPYIHERLAQGEPAELTSGEQIRDFLDVSEAGQMIAEAALSEFDGPMNICSGKPITVRQLAEKIADTYGRRDLLRFGARPDNLIDPPCVVGIRTGDRI